MLRSVLSAVLVLGLLFTLAGHAQAQFEDEFVQGLIGTYRAADGTQCRRIDTSLGFAWEEGTPDPRLSDGAFRARWEGLLLSKTPGDYTLHAYVQGDVRVTLEGEVLLDGSTDSPQWISGKPIPLKFDWHPLQVDFAKTGEKAQLRLFWQGPDFPLEPIAAEYFYHDIEATFEDTFQHGRQLVAGFRCAACHTIEQLSESIPAPALGRLDGNISEPWLTEWLSSAAEGSDETSTKTAVRRMPHFDLSKEDVAAVVEFLLDQSQPRTKEKSLPPKGSVSSGQTLVMTLGCTACHQIGEVGNATVMGGPSLSDIAEKRPQAFFREWLKDPAKLNPDHRMPVYDLSNKQRDDIAAYLATLSDSGSRAKTPVRPFNQQLVDRGRQIVTTNRCFACHDMPGKPDAATAALKTPLGPGNLWRDACLDQPHSQTGQPGYRLPQEDREAIKSYLRETARAQRTQKPKPDAAWILTEQNCLSCHPRGIQGGLADVAKEVVDLHGELASQLPAMVPPSLNSVGDKLHDEALLKAIRRSDGVHRPWLKVQMPKFDLTPQEQQVLVEHFVSQDRIPDNAPATIPVPKLDGLAATVAGSRLVTTDGFGCTSCHQVGEMVPPKAPLNAMGPDLSLLGERIREPWFYRWVHSPARIVPRMEMPSVQIPVQGVLENDLDAQLASVWHVLNKPDFTPPKPDPVRVVRQSGQRDAASRSIVLTDVIKLGTKPEDVRIKPLVVGLPSRNTVRYDLESASLEDWWVGDVARQRSEGKTWFWEPGGQGLLGDRSSPHRLPEVLLWNESGQRLEPFRDGQFFTRFETIEYEGESVVWTHLLRFGAEGGQTVRVRQRLEPLWTDEGRPANGFRRTMTFDAVPEGHTVGVQLPRRSLAGPLRRNDAVADAFRFDSGDVQLDVEKTPGLTVDDEGQISLQEADQVRMTYRLNLPGETFTPKEHHKPPQAKAQELDIVPGWSATRLPLSMEMMPIALDWQPDGSLIAASLKGRLWKLWDTDGDGLEDRFVPFGDEYAAPYGVKAHGEYVDITNKYALLRLWDENGDGQVERVQNLAHGWGHTNDYHDWTVGLPMDAEGNYYAATACQQDKRTPEAARLRGVVFKLTPEGEDPKTQTYHIEELTAGHRFPMGIARNRRGEMFVTDNQGNYNPFNELNHIVPGKRYGFLNAVERTPGFKPEETPPAVAIPHPWTRSVNGICFLETPAAERERLGYDLFGPWEGDLVGCEYDTRRLVRMSLDHVGDVVQGAAYPMTYDPAEGADVEKGLLGPISCAVAPDGDLYIGNIRDGGWGGGNNVGTFTRMRPRTVHLPLGIDEVTVTPEGFRIRFTQQVDPAGGILTSNYSVASYTRESTPAYGGDDKQRRREPVAEIRLSADRMEAEVILEEERREGFVYEFFLDDEIGGSNATMWPKEAHYTLRRLP